MVPQLPRSGHLSNGLFSLRPNRSTGPKLHPLFSIRAVARQAAKRAGASRSASALVAASIACRHFECREFTCPKGLICPNIFVQAVRKTASASYP